MSQASTQIGEPFFFYMQWSLSINFIHCRPKAEALVRGLRHSVHCKKYSKRDAIHVYSDAFKENRLEQVLE